MRAVHQTMPGGPEVLKLEQRPKPKPDANQLLVRVAYAGVNRADCNQRKRGTAPAGATDILGLEISGVVETVGAGVDENWIGKEVCALVNGGAYAECCVADVALTFERPYALTLREAAALPEALFTSWFNLIEIGQAQSGDWVLIHGGTSGVGSVAIQILADLGMTVVTTSGTEKKCDMCRTLGAKHAINYTNENFVDRIHTLTEGRGVDVILDMAGLGYAEKNLQAIATDGRIIHIAGVGVPLYSAPFPLMAQKRARVIGSQLRGLELARKARIADELRRLVWPKIGTSIYPVIDSEYRLADVVNAHERMESGQHAGKILLALD